MTITKQQSQLDEKTPSASRFTLLLHSLAFVLGFSLIFIVGWGGAATVLGRAFGTYKALIGKIGGVVVIAFGMYTLGWLKIPFLSYDMRMEWKGRRKRGLWGSGLMGIFFAAGWTPCIGTTLGAILTLGFAQNSSTQAMWLAGWYALGLGVPFILLGLGMERASAFLSRFRPYMRRIQIVSGTFLILIGAMILTDQITLIAIWAQRNGLFLDLPLGASVTPTAWMAIAAGLLSFLSPCVLPLVPAYLSYLSGHAFGNVEPA